MVVLVPPPLLLAGFCTVRVQAQSESQQQAQQGSVLHWFWLPLLPLFLIYFISGVAETNRAPFYVAEGESEIVAGFHVDYSGMAFAVFFLAEYANMILMSAMAAILFLGGWLPPIDIAPINWIPGAIWLILKIFFVLFIPASAVLANAGPPPVKLWLDFVYDTSEKPELEGVQVVRCDAAE